MPEELQNTIDTLVGKLMYYDRKEDDDLPVGEIERMVRDGEATTQQIIDRFAEQLRRSLKE